MQKELGEQRGNWVTALQEYDLEFKPAIIIKGQGLYKLMADNQTNKDPYWENEAGVNFQLMYVISSLLPNIGTEIWCTIVNKDIYQTIGGPSREGNFG